MSLWEVPITRQERFKQYREDEQLKIDELDWVGNHEESRAALVNRYETLKAIEFEAKARATQAGEVLGALQRMAAHDDKGNAAASAQRDTSAESAYRRVIGNPIHWYIAGTALLDASQLLWMHLEPTLKSLDPDSRHNWDWARINVIRPYYLVAGLAIENRLKAVWVRRSWPVILGDISESVPFQLPSELGGNHDLLKLAARAAVDVDDSSRDLLRRLSLMVLWQGRYPAAKRPNTDTFVVDTNDHATFSKIIASIDTCYQSLLARGVSSPEV